MSAHSNDARASASVTQLEAEGLVDARVSPLGSLENLSQREVQQLLSSGHGGVYEMFRRCALAVLASGLESDDVRAIFEMTRLNKAVTIHASRTEALGAWT